jgi:hypothetical protein
MILQIFQVQFCAALACLNTNHILHESVWRITSVATFHVRLYNESFYLAAVSTY